MNHSLSSHSSGANSAIIQSKILSRLLVVTAAIFGLIAAPMGRSEIYSLTILNIPFAHVEATGINNLGSIVGTAWHSNNPSPDVPAQVAYHYTSFGSLYILKPLIDYRSSITKDSLTKGCGINLVGTVVGSVHYTLDLDIGAHPSFFCPFRAWPAGTYISSYLEDPSEESNREAIAITDGGHILERVDSGVYGKRGSYLLNSASDKPQKLPDGFTATGLNDSLVIVGDDLVKGGMVYDFINKTTRYLNDEGLVSAGLPYPKYTYTHASAVSQDGTVAGILETLNDTMGFVCSATSSTRFGTQISQVTAMNSRGDVVGNLQNGHAFVYIRYHKGFYDLNSCIVASYWKLVSATGINDSGQICGTARRLATRGETSPDGYIYQAYKLTPYSGPGVLD